jgi:hypothetical protein
MADNLNESIFCINFININQEIWFIHLFLENLSLSLKTHYVYNIKES